MYGVVGVRMHVFLTSTLGAGHFSLLCPATLPRRQNQRYTSGTRLGVSGNRSGQSGDERARSSLLLVTEPRYHRPLPCSLALYRIKVGIA
jgi:hypothetical protein